MCTGEDLQGSNQQSRLVRPRWRIRVGGFGMGGGGLSGYNTESLSVDQSDKRVWREPGSQYVNDLFDRFRKRVAAAKQIICCP